ncbi:hypothetical protein [Clostridium saccharobutylicum]|uniref:Uncharacterized protein n=1 Tax=Clostridium saccharobutylicum DSM 13864 TaxID=1345695 RepID=U5MPR0_CLOSA|nr:hypothetical protein [Clostridium saccharobutylicum]AGX41387.1 hypothetical protein CLSA_c03370 [Clostridium saccharobutylicum DSM 13864]AQR88668.1 hypothetical protein CLOSC_03320 [Clostridium saccharobutylicum]AQR98566.1 hypothetical protein CSACC_03320 [Clostridium saccharobutylicum]AQS12556.1 hypothetical protein CLOSACC_03320 [Clostridium saccharobutylicum]MBA2905575.1 hypothetical protein [Clostridium saccharobutylicum]
MKKILLSALLGVAVLLPTTAAFAYAHGDTGEWYMQSSKTEIQGSLYLVNNNKPNVAQAKTYNVDENGKKVRVKIYATADGQTIEGSDRDATGYPTAYIKSSARKPDAWGSGHTTTPSPDPYEWLYIQVSDL